MPYEEMLLNVQRLILKTPFISEGLLEHEKRLLTVISFFDALIFFGHTLVLDGGDPANNIFQEFMVEIMLEVSKVLGYHGGYPSIKMS